MHTIVKQQKKELFTVLEIERSQTMRYPFIDPFNLVRVLFHPPQNPGCAVPLKTTREKRQTWASKSWLRALNSLAQCQRCHILIPHCTNLSYLAGSSPSFHSLQYFELISHIVLSASLRRSPGLTVLPTWDTTFSQHRLMLSSNTISPSSYSAKSCSSGMGYPYGEPGG